MNKTPILGAMILALFCGLTVSTSASFAADEAAIDHSSEHDITSNATNNQSFQALQDLIALTERTLQNSPNGELQAALTEAIALNENSDPDAIESAAEQLSNLLAALLTTTAYDADATSGDSSTGSGGDPADDFEDKHDPSNGSSSSSSSSSSNDSTPEEKTESTQSSNQKSVSRGSTPNTGIADQSSVASAVANSAICFIIGAISLVGFGLHRYCSARAIRKK